MSVAQRVGALGAGDQMPEGRRRRGPQSERAVDVEPGAGLCGRIRDQLERVDRPRVHVPGRRADDRRALELPKRRAQRVGKHPALVVRLDRKHAGGAEAEEAERPVERGVPLVARDDVHGGCADEAPLVHVPAHPLEHGVARCGKRGEVRHLAARDEAERHAAG